MVFIREYAMAASTSHAQKASERESVLFKLVRKDHDDVRELLDATAKGIRSDDRERSRTAFAEALEQHMAAEERVLYPALARIPALRGFIDRMRAQHESLRDGLATLAGLPASDPDFDGALDEVRHTLAEHVNEEENALFTHAVEHLAGELEQLAVELEAVRQEEHGSYGVG